jgi:D-alanyl-D-alanine carboxypeptidase
MMLDDRSIQRTLISKGFLAGEADGRFGKLSIAAAIAALRSERIDASKWPIGRLKVGASQWVLNVSGFAAGAIDGYVGSDTKLALERWQNAMRDVEMTPAAIAHQPNVWPRQKDMHAFYGAPGTNHVSLDLPYPMRIAWDKSKTVRRITVNSKCSASLGRVFARVLEHYGHQRLFELNLDLFGGVFANRPMRGGTSLSTHAYACAIDVDPEHNQLRWGSDRAAMARVACAPFVDAFEAEGWISLGRERNYDWMHFQAARL